MIANELPLIKYGPHSAQAGMMLSVRRADVVHFTGAGDVGVESWHFVGAVERRYQQR